MSDTPRLDGVPDPKKASQLSSDDSIDPEKFKRILKVDDSEEPAKQQKRQKSKKQEEEEETLRKETDLNIPTDLAFSSFFDTAKNGDGIFKVKETEKAATQITASEGPLPPTIPIIPPKKAPEEIPSILKLEGETSKSIGVSNWIPGSETSTPNIPFETPKIKIDEQDPLTQSGAPLVAKLEEEKKEEGQDKGAQLVTPVFIDSPALMTVETPVYAHLTKDVFDLFEKMIGLMTIESYKGISITTIRLSLPNSVFNDCEIRLEHYDTAPNSFNVQLLGTPHAVDLFNANFQSLVEAFQQPNQTFKANIRRPILLEKYQNSFKQLPPTPAEQGEQAS